MRANHRKSVAKRDRNGRVDASELAPQHDVPRCGHGADAVFSIEPMHAEQVLRIGGRGIDASDPCRYGGRNFRWIGKLC